MARGYISIQANQIYCPCIHSQKGLHVYSHEYNSYGNTIYIFVQLTPKSAQYSNNSFDW